MGKRKEGQRVRKINMRQGQELRINEERDKFMWR